MKRQLANTTRIVAAISVLALGVASQFVAPPIFHWMAGFAAIYFWASSITHTNGKLYVLAASATSLIAIILGVAAYA